MGHISDNKHQHMSLNDLIERKLQSSTNPTAQLFAPSEAGYTTDATEFDSDSGSDSEGGLDSEIETNSPKKEQDSDSVEKSAESIGQHFTSLYDLSCLVKLWLFVSFNVLL